MLKVTIANKGLHLHVQSSGIDAFQLSITTFDGRPTNEAIIVNLEDLTKVFEFINTNAPKSSKPISLGK